MSLVKSTWWWDNFCTRGRPSHPKSSLEVFRVDLNVTSGYTERTCIVKAGKGHVVLLPSMALVIREKDETGFGKADTVALSNARRLPRMRVGALYMWRWTGSCRRKGQSLG